jgi:hypothetical protein
MSKRRYISGTGHASSLASGPVLNAGSKSATASAAAFRTTHRPSALPDRRVRQRLERQADPMRERHGSEKHIGGASASRAGLLAT